MPTFLQSPRKISIAMVLGLVALVLVIAPDVPMVIFAGILLGIFLRGGGDWIAARLGLGSMGGMAIFIVAIVLAATAIGFLAAPLIAEQFHELVERIPIAYEQVRGEIMQYSWGPDLLEQVRPEGMLATGGRGVASAVAATFGVFGNTVLILIIGIYLAVDPGSYVKGLVSLFAPSLRPRTEEVIHAAAATLRRWLAAQLLAMAVVGVLTGTGLWILGVPLAPMLGLIAGLLAFVPTLGPILSMIPGILLSLGSGTEMVIWVVCVYMAVQAIESYLITPIVQREMVSLPPAVTITMQLLFGVLFGLFGLALATPIAAAGLTVIRLVYVDFLNQEKQGAAPEAGETPAAGPSPDTG